MAAKQALKKILMVEDEEDIRAIAQIALEEVGSFQVEFCSCGSEALQKAPQFVPDLILLDVMMPGMDGVSTYNELRKQPDLEKIPVIFMTAKVQKTEIEHYISLGAIDVIPKPFDPMTLADDLSKIWLHYA